MLAKFRYCETAPITPSGGTVGTYIWNCNDLFDPNFTGTGHQPLGFDQYMVLYNHYTVIGAKITVTFIGDTAEFQCGIGAEAATTPTTHYQLRRERPRTVYRIVSSTATDNGKAKLTYKWSAKNFFGTKAIIGEDTYKGSASSSPTERAHFHVFAGAVDNSTVVGTVKAIVQIDYIAMLTEPKALAQS